ncbi:tetratricopeptide repeat protein [Corallococcus exercitus]|uniref:Serine hydrolase n=1 Tax=Corallococcus exercitus TaxID=2316736 RepID=A0A3A8HMA6_9BACT|nr:serine hydrolase [Corallococcus exercitus]NOK36404.1 serine hydrolase [Corallococcus exercitus]RKG72512.1 tetratricopeptide repeat protein [Corallococcus exercitus]
MTWNPLRLLGVLAVALLFVPVTSGAATRQQELDRLLTQYHQLRQFNGAALVANEKGVILKKAYGSANFEWNVPNTVDTKFRLASVTKQFTAMVILQLVAEGKLKLDDTLVSALPDYRKDTGARVTIAQLLNHTSGIPNYTNSSDFFAKVSRNPYSVADFVKQFASGDLEFEPGSKFNYSNSGYFLLGAIIERATGKTYAQAVQERIFTPLGMKDSGYDVHATVLPKRASGYELDPKGYVNAPYLDMSLPYAAGSLYSTVEDLYRWDRALYENKLLPEALKQKMFTPGLENYGFGVFIEPLKLDDGKTELATIHHSGGINGFSTRIYRVPATKEVVILLDNTSRGDALKPLSAGLFSVLHGIPPKAPRLGVREVLVSALDKGPIADTIARYRELRATKADAYDFSPEQLNSLGYRLLRDGRTADAIELFKLNVEMFPKEGNVYDSLGEAYLAAGDKEQARVNYRKAVELDPANKNAAAALKKLDAPASAPASKVVP